MNYTEQAMESMDTQSTQGYEKFSAVALAFLLSYQVQAGPEIIEPVPLVKESYVEGTSLSATFLSYVSPQAVVSQIESLYDQLLEKSTPLEAEFRVDSYDDMWNLYG